MDRRVRAIKRDRTGNIVALCNPGESWSPRRKADVIKDITNNRRSYYVEEVTRRVYVRLVSKNQLQTTEDKTSLNNLEQLPTA